MTDQSLFLNPLWKEAGASFMKTGAWEVPAVFSSSAEEYAAASRDVVLIDQSHRGKIDVTGKDRVEFLHRMLSNDIKRLQPGDSCMAAFLKGTGKVLGLMNVFCFNESLMLDVEAGYEAEIRAELDKFILADQVKLMDVTNRYAWLYLWGPQAAGLIEDLFWEDVRDLENDRFATINFGNFSFSIMRSAYLKNAFTLYTHKDHTPGLVHRILEKGKGFELRPAGEHTYEMLRIEAGMLKFGKDIVSDMTLPETGLISYAVNDSKGCYPGQEVVARTVTYGGLNRKVVRLKLEGEIEAVEGKSLRKGDKIIGNITSACKLPGYEIIPIIACLKKPYFSESNPIPAFIDDVKVLLHHT